MNMNKMLSILAVVIVVGLGAWWAFGHHTSTGTDTNNTNQSQTADNGAAQKTSIQALMETGHPVTCTYTIPATTTTAASTAKIYVDGKRMSTSFDASAYGATGMGTGHMVSDGTNMYVWYDGTKVGFKMALPSDLSATTNPSSNAPSLNQSMDYSCSAWTADNATFSVPANINFSNGLSGMSGIPSMPTN